MTGGQPGARSLTSILDSLEYALVCTLVSTWQARPWGAPWAGHDDVVAAANAVTEIGLDRGMCLGTCPAYTVTFRRGDRAEFVGGAYVDMLGPHDAELEAGSFGDLARAVMLLRHLAPPGRDASNIPVQTLDLSTTSVWVTQGGKRDAIKREEGLVAGLLDEAASELRWRRPDGDWVDRPGSPPPRPLAPGEQRDWTTRRYAGSPTPWLAALIDAPSAREALTSNERRVLQLRHGLIDGRDWTHEAIGKELDLTPARVGKIEAHAWQRVRDSRLVPGNEVPPGEPCPKCGEGVLTTKNGRFGPFVGCSRYPHCEYIQRSETS